MTKAQIILVIVLLVVAVIVFVPLWLLWDDGYDPRISVRTRLDAEISRLDKYKLTHGHFPSDVHEVEGFFFINDGVQYTDWWGMPFHYSVKNGIVILYSNGPNMIDDGGTGDDVLPSPVSQ